MRFFEEVVHQDDQFAHDRREGDLGGFARQRIYDARLALALLLQGAKEFATASMRDFNALGFARVWNPLEE